MIADDREPASVVSALRGFPDVDLTIQRLEIADYLVAGRFLVERKTILDLAESVRTADRIRSILS